MSLVIRPNHCLFTESCAKKSEVQEVVSCLKVMTAAQLLCSDEREGTLQVASITHVDTVYG